MKFPFESKILEWACNFSSTMAKLPLSAFSIILNSKGIVQQIIFGEKAKKTFKLKETPDEPKPG